MFGRNTLFRKIDFQRYLQALTSASLALEAENHALDTYNINNIYKYILIECDIRISKH